MKMEKTVDKGQDKSLWSEEWKKQSPESEIKMWDFYGLRPWILKFIPRNGLVLEAGCGLGRYVFYLSRLGIDIMGLDFSKITISFLNKWKSKNTFKTKFIEGDVCDLPFEDNSISGYLSLGVIEHFQEGPKKPLSETFRVLRPGGVAIISTPSISWLVILRRIKKKSKKIVKKIIGRKILVEDFFQYEYRPRKLKELVSKSGLCVSTCSGADLMYTFCELGNFKGDNLKRGSFAYWFANKFENTIFSAFGAQSVTISIKLGEKMHCFFCDELKADKESLNRFNIPVCAKCASESQSDFYLKNMNTAFHNKYKINPPIMISEEKVCTYCRSKYATDPLFENYGFDIDVCGDCLKLKENNIKLSNENIQPIWRKRSNL